MLPASLRCLSRRNRALSLMFALAALIIAPAIIRRQTGYFSSGVASRRAPVSPHGEPVQFYGAARHLSDQRRTLDAPPSGSRGTTESSGSGSARQSDSGGDPGQVSDHKHAGGKSENKTKALEPGSKFLFWDLTVPKATAEQKQHELSPEWLARRHQERQERRQTLAAACRRYNVTLASEDAPDAQDGSDAGDQLTERIKASHLSSVPQLGALVCLVHKVASSSLLGTLLRLAGQGVPIYNGNFSSPHAHAKALQPQNADELESARRLYLKVLFVRHPMDRLISAYEDKAKRNKHKSLKALRDNIFAAHEQLFILDKHVELYSKHPEKRDELGKAYYAALDEYKKDVQRRDSVPTFQEFLDFILLGDLTGDGFDSHWTPYWRQCAPCHMNYDVIGKLETGTDDFSYVWNLLGIYKTVAIPWLNQQPQRSSTALDDRLREYVTPLRRDTIQQLRRLFRPDFHMFGYDWRGMLDASGHCQPGKHCDLE